MTTFIDDVCDWFEVRGSVGSDHDRRFGVGAWWRQDGSSACGHVGGDIAKYLVKHTTTTLLNNGNHAT